MSSKEEVPFALGISPTGEPLKRSFFQTEMIFIDERDGHREYSLAHIPTNVSFEVKLFQPSDRVDLSLMPQKSQNDPDGLYYWSVRGVVDAYTLEDLNLLKTLPGKLGREPRIGDIDINKIKNRGGLNIKEKNLEIDLILPVNNIYIFFYEAWTLPLQADSRTALTTPLHLGSKKHERIIPQRRISPKRNQALSLLYVQEV